VNVLVWHVHGSWMTSFVAGPHTYLIPCTPDRGPDGRGRAASWDWPPNAVEVPVEELADAAIDVVVLQRPRDLVLCEQWLGGRRPGRDLPGVWLEHNAPQGRVDEMRHPAADRDDLIVVHVTPTNDLFWDTGSTRTRVIEHGIADPGARWTGELAAAGVVINEPLRRGRVTGTDLLPRFGRTAPIDLMGMQVGALAASLDHPRWLGLFEDLPQHELHTQLARRRCYLHPFRWTSLGLALVEAMTMGMPVVAVATLEVPRAVPPGCGVVSTDVAELTAAVDRLVADPAEGAALGQVARAHALDRYGLERFLHDWDRLLEEL